MTTAPEIETTAMRTIDSTAPDPALLRQTFSSFPSGVVAVCALIDGVPVGMAVSSFTSVSLDPPLVSVCVDSKSSTWPTLSRGHRIGVSVLAEDHGVACRQLAARSGDRFAGLDFDVTDGGAILLHRASAWFECSLTKQIAAGDHDIALLEVRAMSGGPQVRPLVFHGSEFHRLRPVCV